MTAIATIADMVRTAEQHAESLADDRLRAIEYYDGKMRDTPSDKGRSAMTTRDLRAQVKKVLPSLMRTLLGSSQVVEFLPVEAGDDEGAQAATDFINGIVVIEADVRRSVEDALHDALILRNGILRWWFEEKKCTSFSLHTGLTGDAMAVLLAEPDVSVIEHTPRVEMVEGQEIELHDLRIRRDRVKRAYRTAAVPRERFLIHPDAVDLDDSPIVGTRERMRRSDLIAMGYGKDEIFALPLAEDDDYEEDARRDVVEDAHDTHRANQLIDYYELFVRYDMDGDGIAELRHMCFAGGLGEKNLIRDDECDEVQFCDVKVMARPHQWEGISIADDIMDIQRTKTVLLRQTLDNLYWQNNPQGVFQSGAVEDEEPLYNPEFGKPIRVRQGVDARAAVSFLQVPFVAAQSFSMLEYLDGEAQDRTGISDASAGLAPDALQNMTAKASAMIEQAGIGQTEMMVSTAAEGLRRFYRGLLRLIIRHQDVPRMVRLRDRWVEFDPRQWNAEMDCAVNTGLGAGTRERDMVVMQQVMGLQEKLLAGFGPDNPFVKPENVYAALSKLVEAAGLKTANVYFTEPNPEEIAAKLDAMRNQPNPEAIKAQAAAQSEQAKLQAQMQIEQMKAQIALQVERGKAETQANKELAQLQADLETAKMDRETQIMLADRQIAWEREKLLFEQSAAQAQRAEDAAPVNVMAQQMQAALQMMADQMAAASRPKRVIRDENGDVVGLEPVERN